MAATRKGLFSVNSSDEPALALTPSWQNVVRLALPTLLVMLLQSGLNVLEMVYVSRLGVQAVAAVALVSPILLLMTTMSAGGVGGGVSAAVALAMGQQKTSDASQILWHALVLGLVIGGVLTVTLIGVAPALFSVLGAQGVSLNSALTYAYAALWSILPLWCFNLLSAGLRGAGLTHRPARVMFGAAVWLLVISPVLIFGWGPVPALGLMGAGLALSSYYVLALMVLLWVTAQKPLVGLTLCVGPVRRKWLLAIGHIGGLSALGTVQGNITLLLITSAMGHLGTHALAGYGIASRLDTLLIPVVYAIGNALLTLVGMARGAGDGLAVRQLVLQITVMVFGMAEALGWLVALFPQSWLVWFLPAPGVWQAAAAYLQAIGPTYGFFSAGLLLYFVSQGLGKVHGPLLAGLLRLGLTLVGWAAVVLGGAGLASVLVWVAVGNLAMGCVSFGFVRRQLR